MNKHLYRIVYNYALGLFQVVSELVRRPGRGASASDASMSTTTVRPVSLSLWVAFGWIGLASVATAGQIVTDPNAPGNQRPTVLGSPGAAPLINITTPSKAGVSRNTYSDFNVDASGVVLNNSRTNTSTQLAGSVGGNPWLATGTAKVILNEVTGSNPSALNGYIEVAGDRAQVIIANPAGISCDGCGVINANRFTLTTGTPELNGGALDGYRVTGGAVRIGPNGLDATHADYTDIIARAVQVNGGIWSPQLQVTTGSNQVNADQSQVTAIAGSGEKPTLALDVSALGGMYANKIVLLGTENGVGARNAGNIGASAGDLVVTIDGRLENSRTLQSQANTRISASGGVSNAGTISATRELAVNTPADVDNSNGTLNAARIAIDAASLRNAGGTITQTGSQGMTLDAGALSNRNGGRICAAESAAGGSTNTPSDGTTGGQSGGTGGGSTGDRGDGTGPGGSTAPITPIAPLADGILHISGLLDNDGGRISAAAGFDLASSTGLANDGGQLELRQLTLTGGNLSNQGGTLQIDGASTIHANQINNDAGKLSFASAVAMNAQSLSNRSGTLTLADGAPMTLSVAGLLDNTNGMLATNAAQFTLNSGTLINEHGTINHAGSDGLALRTGDWRGANGTVVTAGAAQVSANTIDHQGAKFGATQLTLNAANLDNRGGAIATSGAASNTLQVNGALDNSNQGTIDTQGDLAITATTLGNAGGSIQQAGNGRLAINATTLNGAGGTLATNGSLTVTGTTADVSGGITSGQQIGINADTLITRNALLVANGDLTVHANAIDNRDTRSADPTQPRGWSGGRVTVDATSVDNRNGYIGAQTTLAIQSSGRFDNSGGSLGATGATTIHAYDFINRTGIVQASGAPLTVTADGLLDNSAHGKLSSDGDLTLTAAILDNTQGSVEHAGNGALTIHATTLNGQGGTIASNGALTLTGETTNLRAGSLTQAQSVAIDTGSLTTAGGKLQALGADPLLVNVRNTMDNTGGIIIGNGSLSLNAGALLNRDGGQLTAAGTGASRLYVTGLFDNTHGMLGTVGTTTLHAGALDNTEGTIQAASAAPFTVTVDGQLTNDRGALQTNGALDLTAGALGNHSGAIQAQKDTTAHIAGTFDNTAGLVVAGGDLDVHAQTLINRNTAITDADAPPTGLYGQHIALDTGTLDNTQGQVQARNALSIKGDTLTNVRGVLDGTGTVTITGITLDNTGGQVNQRGDSGALSLTLSQGLTNTLGGRIGAEGAANLHADSFDNSGGTTFARHDLNVSTDGDLLNRDGGVLQTNHALTLNAQGTLDNSGGGIDATNAAVINASAIANAGGQILAGNSASADAALRITAKNAIDNRGGTIGNRGGNLTLAAASIDNSGSGTLIAQRDLNLDAVGALNNAGGTVVGTRNLSYQNGSATLDNTGGKFGVNGTASLTLGTLTNTGGRVQADTLWLTTPTLNNDGGDIGANDLHVTLVALNGLGALHGTDLLDAHFLGDYTHLIGQQLQSNGVLSLTVDGTLTNQGILQTQGSLRVTAATLINQGTINASNGDGTASASLSANGLIDNQAGASIAGDALTLNASDITNTSSQGITGDVVQINANTLTNGRNLGTADAAVAYGEGFIGASEYLDLRIGQRLANLDGDIYSGGELSIAGRANGTRVATLDNVSGRIQADGNGSIAADLINNRRRFVETEQYTLSPAEQAALSSDRAYDNALTASEQQRMQQLLATDNRTIPQIAELLSYLYRTGWSHVDHVTDADLAVLNTTYNQIAIDKYGQRGGYLVVDANGNPAAEYKQTDTYLTGARVTRESADSQILTGGNLSMDLGTHLTNFASTIAATGDLTISGHVYDGTPDARIDNIAVAGQYSVQRDTDAIIITPVAAQYLSRSGWKDTMVIFSAPIRMDTVTEAGPVLAAATITGRNVSMSAHDITNTAVQAAGGIIALPDKDLSGPESTSLGSATTAQAGNTGPVQGARGDAVHNAGTVAGSGAQAVGTANLPLPGYVPPSNGKYSQNGDPGAPFLVNTAPRFAKGPVTSSDYLLRALGDDPTNIHKRLGDGYYEQNLVLDQLLQLTGRRTLNGGDGLSQYTALMDSAAAEASRLGLQLGAPLTTEQIASLSSDIVWLVDQVVNGEHVLVPVVYLSKATADRLKSDGALIAGDTVNVKAGGTLRNDGTITGTQGTSLSADTLINRGAINGGQALSIATAHDTINQGTLSGHAIGIVAGGSVVNAPSFDGIAARGGVISAGTGGVQIVAANDVINQGKIASQDDGIIVAGRDYVQNAAVSQGAAHASAGSLSTAGSAAVIAGRDATFDQSTVNAGQVAYIEAGRDAHFTAATVSGGTGVAVKAGQDIISDTVTDHAASTNYTKQGKNWSSTVTTEDTVRGSTFTSGGDITMQAGRDINLTAANVKADGAIGLSAVRDINLTTAQSSATQTQDNYTKRGKVKTTTHSETTDAVDVGTTLQAGSGVAMVAGRDISAKAAQIDGGQGAVQMGAGRDINVTVGEATHTEVHDSTSKKSGFWSKAKTTTHSDSRDTTVLGTTINGQGVAMVAGRDVHATSAQISAKDGAAVVVAGRDLTLDTASDTHEYDSTTTSKGAKINSADRPAALAGVPSGLLTRKKTTTTTTHEASTDAVATTLTGDSVTLSAGRDMTLNAAQIGATHDITAAAGNNLTVGVATNTYEASQSQTKKKTGLQESGGSVMYGKTKTAQTNSITQTTPEGSLIGSTDGSVTMVAGNAMHLTDATVLSNTGTTLIGKNVTIDAAVGSTDITQTQKQSSLGIKAGLSGGVASAAMGAYQSAKRGNEVKDDRLKALYAAQAGYAAYDTYQYGKAIESGKDSTGGASLRIGIGASSASSKTTSHDDTAYGSTIRSNGNVIIAATNGDLNVIGSQISGDNVALAASNRINLRSQEEDHTLTDSNKNGSGEVGFSIGSQTGWYVSASAGKGDAHGNGTTHATTNVNAANTLSLSSGGDTTIEGAQATGKTVLADIGGNLSITSQQDTNDFASKQTQAGGTFVYGYGGSASFSQGNTNSQYKSVTTVSGIGAGEGGYNIHVGGNTALNGGVIASTADASKNRLDTGSLSVSDIENQAKYSAINVGVGGGNNKATGPIGIAPGLPIPQGDSSHSTTRASIANGTIIVRNGDADLSTLDRNATLDRPALKPIFDQQKVQERQEMGQVAGYVGMRTAGTIASYMVDHATTEEEKASWSNGGRNKVILHGLVGAGTAALGNGDAVGGAIGAGVSEAASAKMLEYLDDQHITDPAERATFMNLASAVIGGATGGGAGAATALQGEQFNRQLHEDEKARIKQLANGDPQREAELSAAACYLTKCYAEYPVDSEQYQALKAIADVGGSDALAGDRTLLLQQTTIADAVSTNYGLATTKPLFRYNLVDTVDDSAKRVNNTYQVGTRVLGGLQAIGGAVDTAAGYLLCATGAGCLGGGALVFYGSDQYQAGFNTAQYGAPQPTLGGYLLQQAGLSPATSELLYAVLGMSPAAIDAIAANKAINAWTLANADARASYSTADITTSYGTANATTYQGLKNQLVNENMANIASQDQRLAAAAGGSGGPNPNFSIGSGTSSEADQLGMIWVGDGAKPTSGGGWISADGTRVYRPPTDKPNTPAQFNPTGVQANFVTQEVNPITGATKITSNGHLVIRP